ncbi:MAG: nucleoside deaminase [bacterium]
MNDKHFLQIAISKAGESVSLGGFPAGAILVKDGQIIGEGVSVGNKLNDPTSHGEMVSIREACKKLKTTELSGSVLYSSMQPCLMCLGASMWGSVSKIIYACSKEKVDVGYYGGEYLASEINSKLIRPIELIHFAELEEESLKIVRGWEKTL